MKRKHPCLYIIYIKGRIRKMWTDTELGTAHPSFWRHFHCHSHNWQIIWIMSMWISWCHSSGALLLGSHSKTYISSLHIQKKINSIYWSQTNTSCRCINTHRYIKKSYELHFKKMFKMIFVLGKNHFISDSPN